MTAAGHLRNFACPLEQVVAPHPNPLPVKDGERGFGRFSVASVPVQVSRTSASPTSPQARADVREAPRHEVAGGEAPVVQRALWR